MAKPFARGRLFPALPPHFIAKDRGRGRHVERVDVAVHRDRDDAVAMLGDVAADAFALVAEDQGDFAGEVD